jgi:hypothetical protein
MKQALNEQSHQKRMFKTKSELAQMLGIHINTLRKKMKESGIPIKRGTLSPQEVAEVLRRIGYSSGE